ncbi:MAG: ribonuclease R family protein [Phycisphaerales bacterium]
MALRFKKRLMMHMEHSSYEASTITRLAEDLRVDPEDREAFEAAVEAMAEHGEVLLGDDGLVTLPPIGHEVVGNFRKHPKGFGFIIPRQKNEHGDIFVPPYATLNALTGDTVRAEIRYNPKRAGGDQSPYYGEIVEIVERKQDHFVGELRKQGSLWLVFPDGKVMTEPVVIRDVESKDAKEGDKVVFDVVHFPEDDGRGMTALAEGVITKVLGASGLPTVETEAVIEAYNLPGEFPDECVTQAKSVSAAFFDEIKRKIDGGEGFDKTERLDLRDALIMTIDPPDAKDYDDAISIERIERGPWGGKGWRLGVHIADVAHFIDPNSPLDMEARDRANSCYLPRLVIPMLPEVLSNGICSLMERVPRYAKSVFIEYDEGGHVKGAGFAQSVIESSKRMTYLEAQAYIDGKSFDEAKQFAKNDTPVTDEMIAALHEMNRLAKTIERRREKQGMIHLELPDVELVYDDKGHVIDAVPEDDAYTHTLIEMFMVEANEAVARLFGDLNVPIMRRIHPEPVPGQTEGLNDFVRVAGYSIPKNPTREDLQVLLKSTAGTPAAPAVHMAVLRTLTRAEYSPALIGHFALASSAYSHFTSPIRRYPDLLTHRALAEYLKLTKNGTQRPAEGERKKFARNLLEQHAVLSEEELVTIGNHCNHREDNATQAERELRAFLVLQLLSNHIGESFPGLITGVTNAGVFIRLDKYLAEGMIKTADLPAPKVNGKADMRRGSWSIDKRTGALVDRGSGRSFNIGDRVEVTIAEIDLARRQMELLITDPDARNVGRSKQLAGRLQIGSDDAFAGGLSQRTGAERRSQKSKSRDKRKSDYRADRKGKGKRQ